MGCCNSTPSNSPYEPSHPTANTTAGNNDASSRAAITSSTRALNPSALAGTSTHRPNQRIRPPSPLRSSPKNVSQMPPPWTRSHLERERKIFFETRVTGTSEVWSAVDMVCQLLRRGEIEEAQGILDAAGLSVPNGRVARGKGRDKRGGIYDERGVLYEVPEWIVADPRDVVEDGGSVEKEVDDGEGDDGESEVGVVAGEDGEEEDKEIVSSRPKGKGRAEDIGEEVRLRARLSDRGSDVEVTLGSKQTVRVAVQKIREQTGCNRLRLVYMGKPMDEGRTLRDCGWRSGQVVNAFVFEGDESVIQRKKTKTKNTS